MILLVEDDSNDAALILRILEQQVPAGGIRHVSDGGAAIELLQHWDGEPLQLVLLDLHLPTQSGLDVLEQLRRAGETRHVPVVVMSGSSDADDVARSYDLGANSFLRKTDRAAQFEETVRQIAPYWLTLNQPYTSHKAGLRQGEATRQSRTSLGAPPLGESTSSGTGDATHFVTPGAKH